MVKQTVWKDSEGVGGGRHTGKHARVSDPIEIPLRPDQTNLLVMIGARAGRSRASLDAAPRARRARHKKEEASQGFHSLRNLCGLECLFSIQGHALSGAVREDRGLATEHREQRGREPSLLQHQAIRSTKMYHESLSEPPPITLRHEAVLFVSPLCDSHSKHVEKVVCEEHSREENDPRCVSNRRAWQVW